VHGSGGLDGVGEVEGKEDGEDEAKRTEAEGNWKN
jgi:hypothetical protein